MAFVSETTNLPLFLASMLHPSVAFAASSAGTETSRTWRAKAPAEPRRTGHPQGGQTTMAYPRTDARYWQELGSSPEEAKALATTQKQLDDERLLKAAQKLYEDPGIHDE